MKIALETREDSEEFVTTEVVVTEKEYSTVLARIVTRIHMENGQIIAETRAANTTNKPDVVFRWGNAS